MASRGKPAATKNPPAAKNPPARASSQNKNVPKKSVPKPAPPKPVPPPEPTPPVEPLPEPAPIEEPPPDHEARRKSSNQFGNLVPYTGSDHWDEDLIPEWLCHQVHNEMITPPSSSEESYDSRDSKGRVVRKRRKKIRQVEETEEEETEDEDEIEMKYRTPSLPDIPLEGWLSKNKLRNLTLQQIQNAINLINDEIELIQTENLVFDRTVKKMEKREIEIEAALPPFTYKFPWEIEGAIKGIEIKTLVPDATCGELSDDEPDPPDGIYKPYSPLEDPDIDREAIAQMLAGEDAGVSGGDERLSVSGGGGHAVSVAQFLQGFGEIPPGNFDVIKHKYGDLVRFASYDLEEGLPLPDDPHVIALLESTGKMLQPTVKTTGKTGSLIPGSAEDEDEEEEDEDEHEAHEEEATAGGNGGYGGARQSLDLGDFEIPLDFEEDPEFPGFNPHDAKRLPIGEKIKYAQIEEESIREEFLKTETEGIQQENSIQVYVDTYSDSYDLSMKMMEAFKAVVADGLHHLTGKMRAEKILRFRDKLKKRFLEEEAKVKIKLTENMKTKRRVDKQLKMAQDIGGTIQMIDYENLRVQNFEFQASIEDHVQDLKKLKFITAEWFEKLERNKDKLNVLISKRKNLESDITVRGNLKSSLYATVDNAIVTAETVNNHCSFLRKRLLAFSAPSTLDYINQKSSESRLKEEVELLKNKVEIMSKHLGKARKSFNRLLKLVPDKGDMKHATANWLEEVKREVKEQGLMSSWSKLKVDVSPVDMVQDRPKDSLAVYIDESAAQSQPLLDPSRRRTAKSIQYFTESNQSAIYLGGMSQSATELYKVGKEKKRLSMLRHKEQEKHDQMLK